VILHHGVHFLDAKQKKIIINKTNRNDLYKELGPPSTIGRFDKEILIYIEKKTTSSRITKLGKKELLVNDVLVLEVNKKGIIVSKKFLNKDDVNNMSFVKNTTGISYDKDAFLYGFIKTLRQKINDPLGKKRGN
jgi:outer membrane protein assembly factor BamE (lipoprotein component of BamABCDE complex)